MSTEHPRPSESFDEAYRVLTGSEPPPLYGDHLKQYWPHRVAELCELHEPPLEQGMKERHEIYLILLMAIVFAYWNGLKNGRRATYPWNDALNPDDPNYERLAGDYLGHNIAALAVDRSGRVLDFEFNHNNLFNSSAEHAEARLVHRLYSLAQLSESWSGTVATSEVQSISPPKHGTNLQGVTIYTSLESCAQCSGVMALAQVTEVVYLQTDPGMYFIGRILRNLTESYMRSPRPVSGGEIGISYFDQLNRGFETFWNGVATTPFSVMPDGTADHSQSVTSFLCTADARAIYASGADDFDQLTRGAKPLAFPDYRPMDGTMRNSDLLPEVNEFLDYAVTDGRRGTPHTI
jgi:tRNA(Arg) A34 adenosine deaminase TadA